MKDVQGPPRRPAPVQRPFLLDRQGWSTLVAGSLLLLISFTTNYGDDNRFQLGTFPAHDQVGIYLHLAALAALAGDVQLASRLRHRARNRDAEARIRALEEASRAGRDREQTARRARIEARCLAAQCRFLLADTPRNRLQLSETLAVLLEELRPPNTQT
jgi:ABC-type uncharacterized transport system YnjBCD ATPase subunit